MQTSMNWLSCPPGVSGYPTHHTGLSNRADPVLTQALHGQTTYPEIFTMAGVLSPVIQFGGVLKKASPEVTPT